MTQERGRPEAGDATEAPTGVEGDAADPEPIGDEAGWSAIVERTRSVLREVASAGVTVTYSELRERLGGAVPHRGPRDLAALLRAASLAEERAGRGLVSAVVVGPSGRPGAGWFRLAAEAGRDVGDRDGAWRRERTRLAARPPGPAGSA